MSSKYSHKLEPMNPAPPVTKIFTIIYILTYTYRNYNFSSQKINTKFILYNNHNITKKNKNVYLRTEKIFYSKSLYGY